MPPVLNFPGVYIEEIPSAVHTITGVATSIAAFAGWAAQGPTNQATLVLSFSDFQNQFGGLDSRSNLGYAVNQFFANGGQQAYIVRVVWDGTLTPAGGTTPAAAKTATATVGGTLTLFASSPGLWGNNLQITVTPQAADPTRFSLQVAQMVGGNLTILENFFNLSATATDPQFVVTVIDNDSQFITFINPATGNPSTPSGPPSAASGVALAGGLDGSVLKPLDGVNGDGNFEIALGSDPSATGNHFGIHLLDRVDIFNLLCVPGETDATTIQNLQAYCANQRAFYIVDSPQTETIANLEKNGPVGSNAGSITGKNSEHAAYYFPWVQAPDPLFGNRIRLFPPAGFVAGIYAATDAARGVWKAPAGIYASLAGVSGLQFLLTDAENGQLNVQAINCLRQFKVYGDVVWGARTLQGSDQAGSQWKYIPIRRLALFLESSLYVGTQWVVFEPNDEALWSQIRLNVGSFLQGLFLQGAFQGTTPQQAYFVKCDAENNPQSSINQGIVNILVGFAPLFPAEFVVIQIQQLAGQTQG
jgi:phage tail sheath protein FI